MFALPRLLFFRSVCLSCALAIILCLAHAPAAMAFKLKSYKANLFSSYSVLEKSKDGSFERVDYQEARDLDRRDEVKEVKVKGYYVSLWPNGTKKTTSLKVGNRTIKYDSVGQADSKTRIVTLYLHGRDGNRHQGMNDWSFGGNFNCIKNLMTRNDGLYISPDFSDFGTHGKSEIEAIIRRVKNRAPKARVFLACGSMGGGICWRFVNDSRAASLLSGVLFLGTASNEAFFSSPVFRSSRYALPLYFGHGENDRVFPVKHQIALFKKAKALRPKYPIRLSVFETGTHGTPIRMLDWRKTLNWMLRAGK